MMFRNLTGFDLRFLSANSAPIPADGSARVEYALPDSRSVLTLPEPDGREVICSISGKPRRVTGLPPDEEQGEDDVTILPLAVASAMAALGIKMRGRVFSPGLLREDGGVKYAVAPVEHPEVRAVYR